MAVKTCKIYTRLCKWTVTAHICTVTVQCVNNFLFFFSLSFIKLQQTSAARKKNIQAPAPAPPPNYNKPNHQSQRHHQTPQPSTETYPKINRNSKINRNPKINPTQNQQKPKNQPNLKSIKTHWETQPKNSPHPSKNAAQRSRICSPICCHCCRRVFHCYRRIFHCCCRLEVGGGRWRVGCGGEREGESEREAESESEREREGESGGGCELDRWVGSELDRLGQQARSEWGKERNGWVSWKREWVRKERNR